MKHFKKRMTVFALSLVILSSMLPMTIPAKGINPYEQTVGTAEFDVSTSFCAYGKTTKIFVDISADSQMSAGMFVLKYDSSVFKAINVETGVVLKNGYTSKSIDKSGEVSVSYANVDPCYEEGRLFEVEFEAITPIPAGREYVNVPIDLDVIDLRNYEDFKLEPRISNGKITLIDTPYGDVNSSGSITASDALMALYANSQLIELNETQQQLADVNGDGKISAADALLILQYSAGSISDYPIFNIATPSNLCVLEKAETYVTLAWDEVRNAIGYNVYMDGVLINDNVIKSTEFTVTGLLENTKHEFAVEALNRLMPSKASDTLSISTDKADRTVIFKDYDGTILTTLIVHSGEDVNAPVPSRKGYTFIGWDHDIGNITADMTLTARYSVNSYNVTFDYQYDGDIAVSEYTYESLINAPQPITREDYTLEGWYRDKNFTKKWNFESDKIDGETILYANWVTWSEWTTDTSLANDDRYTVESKTQYAYSDKQTTTSASASISGWTQDGYSTSYGSWVNADWTKTKPTASDTLQITNTRTVTDTPAHTVYTFYRWKYWNTTYNAWYYTYASSMGGTYQTQTLNTLTGGWTWKGTVDGRNKYLINGWDGYWYISSERNVAATTHTEWYYQTRTKTVTYNYYKWSEYSAWSDSEYTADDNRQVKTRIVYRYKLKQQ